MLYRSTIQRKESEIRQVACMVGAKVESLLRRSHYPKCYFGFSRLILIMNSHQMIQSRLEAYDDNLLFILL